MGEASYARAIARVVVVFCRGGAEALESFLEEESVVTIDVTAASSGPPWDRAQFADHMKKSVATVKRWRKAGMPALSNGGTELYDESSEAWVRAGGKSLPEPQADGEVKAIAARAGLRVVRK
jgi:hypothetical protein